MCRGFNFPPIYITPNGLQNRPQNSQGFIPNGARNMQSRGFRPNGAFNRQQESNFSPKAHQKGQQNRQYDDLSLLNDLLQQNNSGAQNNGRGRGRFNNRSNNSDWCSDEDVVTAEPQNPIFVGGPQLELSNIDDGNLAETGKTFTKIFNLSNRRLNDIEKGVLMMGLKFTPTPEKK